MPLSLEIDGVDERHKSASATLLYMGWKTEFGLLGNANVLLKCAKIVAPNRCLQFHFFQSLHRYLRTNFRYRI
jgi:hypothetical protein